MKKLTKALGRKKYLAAVIPLIMAAHAQGFEFYTGGIEGSFDSQLSVGSSWRMESQDETLLNGTNSNDGNANFENGDAFSQVFKGSHDLQFSYQNFGGFVRGKYWYDSALKEKDGLAAVAKNGINEELDDTDANNLAKFSGVALLDAFIYGEFEVADMPLDVRLGKQVVSWGESTFILGGVNSINPIDVSSFRRPGAEIKEGLIPVNMAFANMGVTDNLSAEVFYQLEFQETVIPTCGTYFSTNDYAAQGCETVIANKQFGLTIGRGDDVKGSDDGQYGMALRYVSEALGDTEFGFYAMNIHSRVPIASGIMGTPPTTAAGSTDSTYFVSYPEDIQITGLSFAANVGSMALSGEVSHKVNVPVQINANDLIGATLSYGTGGGAPQALLDEVLAARNSHAVANGGNPTGAVIDGHRLFDVSQAQLTGIKFFDRVAGASRVTLIGEAGYTFVHGFDEGDDAIKFGQSGIYEGSDDGFVTQTSYGYRARVVAQYSDVFSGVNLKPIVAWKHDVKGFAPNPGGAFREGEKSLGFTLKADYLSTYSASISYTQYMGGDASVTRDRDFASIAMGMQF